MAMENFLINPPKRKPSRKHTKSKAKKRHRILALEKGGGLFTSSQAKIVRKGIKLNPFHRFRSNPLGEELMFVGLNPMKGGKTMAKRHKKRSHRKNPVKRRRYHRNPMSSMKSLIPMVVSGGVGALVGRSIPQFIPILKGMGTLGNVISKVALAVGGAMLLDKTLGKKFKGIEDGWMIGSLASAAADLSAIGIVGTMQGLGMITDYPANGGGVGAFVDLAGTDSPFQDDEGVYGDQ
jgi:hypothetical protein